MNYLFLAILLLFFTSCTLDYSDSNIVEDLADEIPNTIIFTYKTVEIQNGSPVLEITAEKAEVYNNIEETHLTNVNFYNFKEDKVSNHGRSNFAILEMKSGNAKLNGDILIESKEEESFIKAETLEWLEKEKILSSVAGDLVTVKKEDGSNLSGSGFTADLKRKSILFEGKTEGEYIIDED